MLFHVQTDRGMKMLASAEGALSTMEFMYDF